MLIEFLPAILDDYIRMLFWIRDNFPTWVCPYVMK